MLISVCFVKVEENNLALTTLYSLESTLAQRKEELSAPQGKPSWMKRLLHDDKLLCSKTRYVGLFIMCHFIRFFSYLISKTCNHVFIFLAACNQSFELNFNKTSFATFLQWTSGWVLQNTWREWWQITNCIRDGGCTIPRNGPFNPYRLKVWRSSWNS